MTETNGALKGVHVLVVEDEYFLADDLASALRTAGAHPIGPVGTIEQANALLDRERVDAAILDINLRGVMAGPLIRRISDLGLPLVVVSGYSSNALSMSIGDHPYLEKPVDSRAAIALLANQLERVL